MRIQTNSLLSDSHQIYLQANKYDLELKTKDKLEVTATPIHKKTNIFIISECDYSNLESQLERIYQQIMIRKQNNQFYGLVFDNHCGIEDASNPPSYNEKFDSLEYEHDKLVFRQNQSNRIVKELTKYLLKIRSKSQIEKGQDTILRQLKMLKEEAIHLQFKAVTKLIHLAIGKRIWILQIQQKKNSASDTQGNKTLLCTQLHYLKIQSFPYMQIQLNKIDSQTFIFEPNASGKGFNFESCNYKYLYRSTLTYLKAQQTIKQINKIWYSCYKIYEQKIVTGPQKIFMIAAQVFFVLAILVVVIQMVNQPREQALSNWTDTFMMLVGITIPILVIILLIIAGIQIRKPINQETQLSLIYSKISLYLYKKNNLQSKNQTNLHNLRGQWACNKQLLYLQLKWEGIPLEKNQHLMEPIVTMCTQKIMNQYSNYY